MGNYVVMRAGQRLAGENDRNQQTRAHHVAGTGLVQKWLFGSLRHSPKPMTFAEIKATAYPAESYESDMAKALGDSNVGRTRSLRRALRKLCDDGIVLAIGSGGTRSASLFHRSAYDRNVWREGGF